MQCLLEKMGHEVFVINYKSLGFTYREYRVFFSPFHPLYSVKNIKKIYKFRKIQNRLNLTKRIFTQESLEKMHFDAVVIGSDELWNYQSYLIGCDPVYFSKSLNTDKKISYAASFGSVNSDSNLPDNLKDLLNSIEYLSVRDDNSKELIESNLARQVEIVLDPTFLYDFSRLIDRSFANEGKYILVYGLFDGEMKENILQFAKKKGLKIISVGYRYRWCDENKALVDPFQWLSYFSGAEYVITTFYHGLCYSMITKRQFCFLHTAERAKKIGSLLKKTGLEDRRIEKNISVEKVFEGIINYKEVYEKIGNLRENSLNFLEKALS